MPAPKRGLGRGLDALLPELEAQPGDQVRSIACALIDVNPHQPRKEMDEDKLAELAASIREHGVLQPVIVRSVEGRYQLVAGERRWRASQRAGLESIPAVVRSFSDAEMMEVALIENLQRENLNPLEEAVAYQALLGEFGLSQEDLAQRLGKSRPAISNALRLLSLDPEIQDGIARGELTAGHARALLAVEDRAERLRLAQLVRANGLSVRDVERLARRGRRAPASPAVRRPDRAIYADLESRLQTALGTRVTIRPGRRRGVIELAYFGPDDLERLVDLLTGR